MKNWRFWTLICIASLSLGLGACSDDGGGSTVDCGEGTELNEEGTACVSTGGGGEITCGAGTELNEAGTACVSTATGEIECGAGTEPNAAGDACVVDSDACGDNTTLVDGRCVADAALTCGLNTVDEDGQCVPTDGVCAAGTSLDEASGTCVPDASTCGANTTFNPATSVCEADDDLCPEGQTYDAGQEACVDFTQIACGPNTIDDGSGTCVPDETAICGTGASYDADAGQCVADVVCGDGTVAFEGECVTPAEAIARDLTTVAESGPDMNDPEYGGTPEALALPTLGNSAFFSGTIDAPMDMDADDVADQDFDAWAFTGSAGDYVSVMVMANGELPVGFTVTGPNGYWRQGPLFVDNLSERGLLLPYDGAYQIVVAPQGTLALDVGPAGSATAGYVGALELRDLPTANPLNVDVAQDVGLLDLDSNLFQLQGTAGDLVALELMSEGPRDGRAALILLDETATPFQVVEEPDDLIFATFPADNGLHVYVDYLYQNGTRDDYVFQYGLPANLVNAGAVPADGTASATSTLIDAGGQGLVSFTAAPGEVVHVLIDSVDSFNLPDVSIQGPGGVVREIDDPSESQELKFYTPMGGAYVITIDNDDFSNAIEYEVTINSYTPNDLGALDLTNNTATASGGALGDDDFYYYMASAGERVLVDGMLDVDDDGRVDLRLYDEALTTYFTDTGLLQGEDGVFSGLLLEMGDVLLVELEGDINDVTSHQLDLTASTPPVLETEPNDTPAEATAIAPGDTFSGTTVRNGSDPDYYELVVGPGEQGIYTALLVDVDDTYDGALVFENADGDWIAHLNTGVVIEVSTFLEPGTYHVLATGDYDISGDFDYFLSLSYEMPTGADLFLDEGGNETAATAAVIAPSALPATIQGVINSATDEDWYAYTPASDETLNLEAAAIAGVSAPSMVTWELYESDGTTVVADNGAGGYDLTGGVTYLLAVSGFDATGDNSYEVTVRTPQPGEVGQPIPDEPTEVSDAILVSQPGCTVASVSFDVDMSHEYVGDIVIYVDSPDGTTVQLKEDTLTSGTTLVGNYPVDFTPFQSLDAFIGESGDGVWTMRVTDGYTGLDYGDWNSWGVNVTCQ